MLKAKDSKAVKGKPKPSPEKKPLAAPAVVKSTPKIKREDH
ncbi:hypothetical protein CRP171_gp27 [Roseobacter phage CRP-171]|uniref:Uncharacterized protein n=2 Tax=Oceanidvirus TaxID=3425753 RepID=A0AAX3ZZR3_9CAUD|nr:hypothetical protein CRP171_gp27 [Roseobacter phage CRP-171]WMM95844.1 hypothetical protein CRP113_gp27 [Roseobacter phage CRP-113]